jgi:hypothetical protein
MAAGLITTAVSGIAGELVGALDGIFTSDDERNQAQLKMQELLMQPQIQMGLATLQEAKHPSVFVAGWRPALGWICAAGLAWEYIIRSLLASALVMAGEGVKAVELPHLDAEQLMALVAILLGVAGYRTVEKLKGTARDTLR